MKASIFVLITALLSASVFAADLPVCENEQSFSEVREDESCKVTFVRGPEAEQRYSAFDAPEVAPRPNTFPQDYMEKAVILAKYSRELVCWKIQAPIYHMIDGQQVYKGPEQCVRFSCNIIEHKQ